MDFRTAARAAPWGAPAPRPRVLSCLGARHAIAWYDELLQAEDSPLAGLYRIVLTAEDGQTDAIRSALAAWAPGADDWARRLAA
jgi:hypothetical protein